MGHHHKRAAGPLGSSSNHSGGRRPGPAGNDARKLARDLRAQDAAQLIQSTLPVVFVKLTDSQIQQVQRVLDAAVIDPEVQKEANQYYNKAVKYYGSLAVEDKAMTRKGDRAMRKYIYIKDSDKRIRLDYKQLLDADALKTTTDNSDEAAYLEKVRKTLEVKGVYLRIGQNYVRDPEDPSRSILDPRQFVVWLSLGPNGDTIPTKNGRLTREALLGTTVLGAGYYTQVDNGPIQAALDKQIRHLRNDIEAGMDQHMELQKIRDGAFPGVAEVADVLGGADFPSYSIWDEPNRLVLKALQLNVGGNVKGSQAYLVTAAIVTRNAAHLLAQYLDDSTSGAERAVKVLKVARTAGKVAEVGLAVTTGVGAIRGGAALLGEAGAVGATDATVDQAAEQLVKRYVAQNPEIAADLNNVRWVPGPKGTVLGGVKPGTSSGAGTGFQKWP